MSYAVADIVKDVRVAIDENTAVEALSEAGDADTLEMEDIIRSKIPDGINAVRLVAPLKYLDLKLDVPTVSWVDSAKGIGRVSLPDDFMRLALFKMSDWKFGAGVAISMVDDGYRQQWSEFKGVRGNANNPVVAISGDAASGNAVLEFFSSDSADATATLLYISKVTTTADEYDIEGRLYRAVVLKTAALVMAAYGNADMMQLLNGLAEEQMS